MKHLLSLLVLFFCTVSYHAAAQGLALDALKNNSPQANAPAFPPIPTASAALPDTASRPEDFSITNQAALQPFGANLFIGQFAADQRLSLNPDYVIQSGDRVSVALWGLEEISSSGLYEVDTSGNIFLPNVGPISIGGVRYKNLNLSLIHI